MSGWEDGRAEGVKGRYDGLDVMEGSRCRLVCLMCSGEGGVAEFLHQLNDEN